MNDEDAPKDPKDNEALAHKSRRWLRKLVFTWPGRIALVLIVGIIGLRIAAPYLIRDYLNKEINAMEGYQGHVSDVDLSLWRGAYQAHGVEIERSDGAVPVPFVRLSTLDLSLQWDALLDLAIVAEIDVWDFELNFVAGPDEAQTQTGAESDEEDWRELVAGIAPIDINRFELHDATIHYRDFDSEPPVNLYLGQLNARVTNLTNSAEKSAERPASVHVDAQAMNVAPFALDGHIDPFSDNLDFDIEVDLHGLPLHRLNPWLQAYANLDAEEGTFAIYAEVESDGGRLSGFVKPIIDDADFLTWNEEDEGFFRRIYEGIVGAGIELLENQPHGRTALRIPIEGTTDSVDTDVWAAVGSFLRNAFIQVLRHGISA